MKTGVINLCKPPGPTSHDAVDRVRRVLGVRKAGHAGTLDPFAAGVLLVGFGAATRLLPFLADLPKEYEAVLLLGMETDTLDTEGRPVRQCEVPPLDRDKVMRAAASFEGRLHQVPPAHSALKVRGVRAYRLARSGRAVDLPPRTVTVQSLSLLELAPPRLRFRAVVSKGTYLRALGRDLALALGTCGHLESLTRTAIGPHRLEDSVPLDDLARRVSGESLASVAMDPATSLGHLPRVALDAEGTRLIRTGRYPEGHFQLPPGIAEGDLLAAVGPDGSLAAVLRRESLPDESGESPRAFVILRVTPGEL